jgi:hypothetical protein
VTAEEQLLRRALGDFVWYAEQFLWVQDKQTLQLVRLRVKPVQRRLAEKIIADLVAGVPVRIIVLKARREGVSTIVQAIFFWLASLRRHQVMVTLSHHDDTTKELFGIPERFYRQLPPLVRPARRASRRGTVLEFANPSKDPDEVRRNPGLESVMRTVTAKNAGAGQGANGVHVSELGLYEENQIDAAVLLTTLLQIVPTAAGTIVILESTARGVGNEFYRRWKQAERSLAAGLSDFYPFFIAWFEEPTNVIAGVDWDELGDLDDREQRLRHKYVCSAEQLAWRRYAIRSLCGGDPDKFDQEYPESPDVAFLSSGRPYFDQQAVSEQLEASRGREVYARGDLVEDGSTVSFVSNARRGHLRVAEPPLPGEDYLIMCDSSEGSGADPQCAAVFARSSLRVVAEWHGYVDRDELGDHLFCLGHVYNRALIAVELNGGWGLTPIAILRRRGYTRLYRSPGENKVKRKREQRFGWDTTPTNRPLVLDKLGQAIRDGELDEPFPELYEECLVFTYSETGKPQAQPGEHDDRVLTRAIGVHLWQTEPIRHQYVQEQRERPALSETTGY